MRSPDALGLWRIGKRTIAAAASLAILVAGQPSWLAAQEKPPAWLAGAMSQALQITRTASNSPPNTAQVTSNAAAAQDPTTPAIIPQSQNSLYGLGVINSFQPAGATVTADNAFFTSLGTNGRTCFSCHVPQNDWSISPTQIITNFIASQGKDPIFRLVDGAVCPNANTNGVANQHKAYALLLSKGLFRIFLPAPQGAQFTVSVASDPYGCETNSQYGLPAGFISEYRRPVPATNLEFLTKGNIVGPPINPSLPSIPIMWDGREPTLLSQFNDATAIHAQAEPLNPADPAVVTTDAEQNEGAEFQQGIYTAPVIEAKNLVTNSLTALGANGGPIFVSEQNGNNDLFGDPFGVITGAPLPPLTEAFDLFDAWSGLTGTDPVSSLRESIYRGEQIFDNRTFAVNGVSNFPNGIHASCGGCHNVGNVGMNVVLPGLLDTGVADDPAVMPHTSDMPLFNVTCTAGTRTVPVSTGFPAGVQTCTPTEPCTFQTDDLGFGWIDGQCNDLDAFKAPALRGIGARPPFFHDGSAANLTAVVNFYSKRMVFDQPLTAQDKTDLVNFLSSL